MLARPRKTGYEKRKKEEVMQHCVWRNDLTC